MASILSPVVAAACVALCPLAILPSFRAQWRPLVALLLVVAWRFGDEWASFPDLSFAGRTISVVTWNLERGGVDRETFLDGVASSRVDLIALQELTPQQAATIEQRPSLKDRFPYQALYPRIDASGMGVLSSFPLEDVAFSTQPSILAGQLQFADTEIGLIVAHPYPARITTATALRIPVGFDPLERDHALARVRAKVERVAGNDHPLILLGDFNTSPTEPAYDRLTAGLADAHVVAGRGPGWSWRPSRLEFLGIGLLRIDWILVSKALRPVDSWVDCSRPGDHCIVGAVIHVPGGQ